MSPDVAVALTAVVLLFVAAFLAIAETSLNRIDRFRAQALAEEKRRGAVALMRILEDPGKYSGYINSVLLTLLTAQIAIATSVAYLLQHHVHGVWFAAAVLVEVLIVYLFVEAIPKTWAVMHTERAALMCSPVIMALSRIIPMRLMTRPLIWITNLILPGKGLPQGPFVYEQHILALADSAAKEQVIEREEHRLIHSVIEFGSTIAREVMVPRTDMITVGENATAGEAIELALERGYSRIPVHGIESDEINGILFTKDLMRAVRDGQEDLLVAELVRPAKYIPEMKRVAELLAEMQSEKTHMAIVVDEYGSVVGLVTLEDLVEEVVGEITDEYDSEQQPQVVQLRDNLWRVDTRLAVDEVQTRIGLELPHGHWDTVGGLLINAFGRMPKKGESVEVENLRMTVEATVGQRILRARIEYLGEPELVESQGAGE